MNLKKYNETTIAKIGRGKPSISFSINNGVISISRAAATLMNLKKGDRIEFFQNEKEPEDWYIRVSTGEHGFIVHDGKCGNLMFRNKKMAYIVLSSLKLTRTSRFIISAEPEDIAGEKYYFILTRNPLNK